MVKKLTAAQVVDTIMGAAGAKIVALLKEEGYPTAESWVRQKQRARGRGSP